MPPSGAAGDAPTERAAGRATMAGGVGLSGHPRAPGALVLLLAPTAGHAGERLTAHRRRFRS